MRHGQRLHAENIVFSVIKKKKKKRGFASYNYIVLPRKHATYAHATIVSACTHIHTCTNRRTQKHHLDVYYSQFSSQWNKVELENPLFLERRSSWFSWNLLWSVFSPISQCCFQSTSALPLAPSVAWSQIPPPGGKKLQRCYSEMIGDDYHIQHVQRWQFLQHNSMFWQ